MYVHGSGVDITFGGDENYGGILLRSVIKLPNSSDRNGGSLMKQFNGPQIIATELFSNLHPLDSHEKNELIMIDNSSNDNYAPHPTERILTGKRINLSSKPDNKEDTYKNLSFRYLVLLPKSQGFKQKIKGVESLLKEKVDSGKMTEEEQNKILGYNRKYYK